MGMNGKYSTSDGPGCVLRGFRMLTFQSLQSRRLECLLSRPFCRWENRGTERVTHSSRTTQLHGHGGAGTQVQRIWLSSASDHWAVSCKRQNQLKHDRYSSWIRPLFLFNYVAKASVKKKGVHEKYLEMWKTNRILALEALNIAF